MIIEETVCDLPLDTHTEVGEAGDANTRPFTLDGRDYEIDLCERHERLFVSMIDRWAQAARPGRRPATAPRQGRRTRAHRERTAAVRAWGISTGRMTEAGGRIPVHVVREYEQEHA